VVLTNELILCAGRVTRWGCEKITKCSQTHFLSKSIYFSAEENSPKIWAPSVIFKKLPKENNRPIGR
jgi:hypothetical protein